jgi:hypothetical protein
MHEAIHAWPPGGNIWLPNRRIPIISLNFNTFLYLKRVSHEPKTCWHADCFNKFIHGFGHAPPKF